MKKYVAMLAAASCLGGCAAVFEGTSQDIAVNTTPAGASCAFEREGKSIGVLPSTPGTLTVRKSKYDITIRCDKPGYQQTTYMNHSGTTATIAANVVVDLLLTWGVSSIVDSATGADNKYDNPVNITLNPVDANVATSAAAASAPAAPAAAPAPATPPEASAPRNKSSIFND